MSKTEIYLWGTLLALVREQLTAIDAQVAGNLGFFGKIRFSSRTRQIQKFIIKLLRQKAEIDEDTVFESIFSDLDTISEDTKIWSDITPEEITYVRRILVSLAE